MKAKTVVFDMDGVLFDTERICMDVWAEIGAANQLENMEEAILGCIGLNKVDTKEFLIQRYGEDFPYDKFAKESSERFHEKVKANGLPMKSGVLEILEYLKKEDFKIGLASSTRYEQVMEHIEDAGIKEYFQVVVGGDMVKHSKPLPDIYLLACEKLGVDPKEAFAIEDSPNGIRSAHGAGMKAIMVPDLIAPTSEIEELAFTRCKNLQEAKYVIMGQEIERISLEGVKNTRDLGGIKTLDGRKIREHRLLRSGTLMNTTGEDREILVKEYGLKTIVDFRTQAERENQPDPILPGVTPIINPILEEATLGITREKETAPQTQEKRDIIAEVAKAVGTNKNGAEAYMQDMYAGFIKSSFSKGQYKKFFEALLEQKEGAVLWHCSAGKDRVGVGTTLLLSALGVSKELIIADYMKTNEFGKEETSMLLKKIGAQMGEIPNKQPLLAGIRLLFTVEVSFINSVFEQIDTNYGSMDKFLEAEMGLDKEKRETLQKMYLE